MLTTREIETIINYVAEINGISEHTMEVTCAQGMGEHYIGDLVPVTIRPVDASPTLRIIIKVPQQELVNNEIVRFTFQREIFAYTTLLPAYSHMEEDAGIKEVLTTIQCHYHRSEPPRELLVLRDMRPEGYKLFSEDMFLDLEHITLVVQEVAKLHALSFALQITKPAKFAEYVTHCKPVSENTNLFRFMVEKMQQSMATELGLMTNETHKRLLQDCLGRWLRREGRSEGAQVICHSDLWRSNLLFKYEKEKPVRACLLDYQFVQVGSPALDLLFLISACTRRGTRRLHYRALLRLYHRTVADRLARFAVDADRVYPYEQLERELRATAPACLVKTLFGLLTWFGVGGLRDSLERGDEVVQYRKARDNLICDYIEYGYI